MSARPHQCDAILARHRDQRCQQRLSRKWPNLIVVHTPIHARWLNRVEIYFSIVQRKASTPNHFTSLTALEDRLLDFQAHYRQVAKPFQWRFTRHNLESLIQKLNARKRPLEYVTELPGQSTKARNLS